MTERGGRLRPRATAPAPEPLRSTALRTVLLLLALAPAPLLAMGSPWWENYDQRDSYRCPDDRTVVLERNASQASLLSGRIRSTLFREESDAPGLRYRNDRLRLILRGDELILEQLPQRLTCVRTEEV